MLIDERPLIELKSWSSQFREALRRIFDLIRVVLSCVNPSEHLTCRSVSRDLDRLSVLRKIESEITGEADHLRDTFGARFDGVQTSWDQVLEAVQWTARFKIQS